MTILPKEIAFDIDGVFADTFRVFVQKAKEWFGTELDYSAILEYEFWSNIGLDEVRVRRIIDGVLYDPIGIDIRPMPGSVDVLTRLAEFSPLIFVTARYENDSIFHWAKAYLPDVDEKRIRIIPSGASENKIPILTDLDVPYFVEDRLDTCFLLSKSTRTIPIVFDQPWNRKPHPFNVVTTWQDIDAMIGWR